MPLVPATISSPNTTVWSSSATGNTTLSVSPSTVGNGLALFTTIGSSSITVATVSGGGCPSSGSGLTGAWTKLGGRFGFTSPFTMGLEIWIGTVTTAGTSNVTITGSSSISGTGNFIVAKEFTCTDCASDTVWALDGALSSSKVNGSSTTVTWPSLTPAGTLRAYIGYGVVANTGQTTGATAGYTVGLDVNHNMVIYNPNVAVSAQAPIGTQNTAGASGTVAALVTAMTPILPRIVRQTPLVPRLRSTNY